MQQRWVRSQQTTYGFTLVELLIVIVVIGILAGLVIVAYNGIQARALDMSARSSLSQISKKMEASHVTDDTYPTVLPSGIPLSTDFDIALVPMAGKHYDSLTNVQNGVLFAQICSDLITEGLGSGINNGGGTDAYVTGCGNWNATGTQIQGWSSAGLGKNFTTPLAEANLTNFINSIPAGDSYHPNQQPVVKNFLTQLRDRFTSQGGAFPITSFWDDWASPGNGTMKQPLPAPTVITPGSTYCVQATYKKDEAKQWHVTPSTTVSNGGC